MPDRLVGWLYDTPVAVVSPARNYGILLEWAPDGIERWGRGSRVLSVSLPLGSPIGPRDMRGLDFFENLLPEGPTLGQMARLAGVPAADTYGILAAFGRDCAGAIMLLPEGERPVEGAADAGYLPVSTGELGQIIRDLASMPLGAAPQLGFRPSLAGFQRKALLGRATDGSWLRPYGGAPSTWIFKPDGPHAMAANEATCLQLAAACGLDVPHNELLTIEGVPVLAVKRYDRVGSPRKYLRIHQEDGCQATATAPALKYENQGGPSLRALATVLRDFGEPSDLTTLLRRTVFNAAVGNADAHAKNFAILHDAEEPTVRLAPLYDVLSTIALELMTPSGRGLTADTLMGQRIGSESDIRLVRSAALVEEAAAWGIRRTAATAIVTEMLDVVIGCCSASSGDQRVLETIRRQAETVASRAG